LMYEWYGILFTFFETPCITTDEPTTQRDAGQSKRLQYIKQSLNARRIPWAAQDVCDCTFLKFQQDLLFSLAIPRSYPCLAPPPHHDCCRASHLSMSDRGLPSYEDAI
uniref:Ras-GEF domain-containing protein n=1 Tax=Heligmosomoides polygyrus TaxID=6339 RepID=A0A183GP33_HELPZ